MERIGKLFGMGILTGFLVGCGDSGGGDTPDTTTDSSTDTSTDTPGDDGGGYVPDPLGTPTVEEFGEVGSTGGVGMFMDLNSSEQPVVVSIENGTMSTFARMLSRSASGTWTEDDAPSETYAFALDAGDLPHVAFTLFDTDTMTRSFRFGRFESGAWNDIIIDTEAIIAQGDVDMALGADTRIHIAYHDVGIDPRPGVKYAVSQTTDFAIEVVEMQDDGAYVGEECQVALASDGTVYAAYMAESTTAERSIKLATRTAADTWTVEIIELSGCSMNGLDLFADSDGEPQIICDGSGIYWYHEVGGTWVEDLVGYGSLLAADLDSRDMPHVIVELYGGDLVYTRPSGGGWEENTVQAAVYPQYGDLVLDSNDLPHMVFLTGVNLEYVHY